MENGTYSKIYLTVNGIKFILATLSRKKRQERICVQIEGGDHFEVENDGNSDVSLLGYQTRIHQSVDLFAPCGSNGCMTKSDST